eukprot:g2595.t1
MRVSTVPSSLRRVGWASCARRAAFSSDAARRPPTAWPSQEDIKKSASPHWREEATDDLVLLGRKAIGNKKFKVGIECFKESVELLKRSETHSQFLATATPSARNSLNALGVMRLICGDISQATQLLEDAQRAQDSISESGMGDDNFCDRAGLLNDRAILHAYKGEMDESEKLLKQCYYMVSRAYRPSNRAIAACLGNLGEINCINGDFKVAVRNFEKALFQLQKDDGNKNSFLDILHSNVQVKLMASMGKATRMQATDPECVKKCRTLLNDARISLEGGLLAGNADMSGEGIDQESEVDRVYITSQEGSCDAASGDYVAASQHFLRAFEISRELNKAGLEMPDFHLICENNLAIFSDNVETAQSRIKVCMRSHGNTSSKLTKAIEHNHRVIFGDSIGGESAAVDSGQAERLGLPGEKVVYQLNHPSFIFGFGVVANQRPSEFSMLKAS